MTELPESVEPAASRPERASILLVDDTPANLVSLRAILQDPAHSLVEARSGEEALDRLKDQEFAVVLLDIRIPGISGFDIARHIRADERSRHTPIIFVTAGDVDRTQLEAGYALGAVDFLVKPLSPVIVQAKVRGLVQLFLEKQRAKHEADQLRLLVQGTIDYAIFMLDPQGRVVTWNAGAERIKGYQADEIIGQHFSKFYLQQDIDRGWPSHELRVATAEGRFEDEGWRLRKDGTPLWANVVITALRDEKGQLRGFSKVTRDLTERKQAKESLRRSEERFRHMVEGVRDYAIFMLDPQGHVTTWNAGAERFKGYKADEIIGQHFSKFYPEEALHRGWPAYELKVAAAEGRFEDEGWRVRKDGSQFWANVVITAIQDDQGGLLGFTKVTRDLTARKQAEENARRLAEEAAARQVAHQERERLRVTLESIGDAVISTDAEGRVTFLNPVAETLVGWRAAEAAGRGLEDVFHIVNEETRQPVENPARRALRHGKIVGLANHTLLISKDGTETPIDDSAAPIRNEQGEVFGSVLVFRDITERKRNEAAVAKRMRLLALNAAVGEALVQGSVLPAVGETLGWDVGFFWMVNGGGDRLECFQSWHRPDVPVPEFEQVSRSRSFLHGEGLPGQVWATGQPAWILDILEGDQFPSLASAADCGLRSAFACPVAAGDRTLGIFEFFTRRARQPDADVQEMMGTVAGTVGQFMERRRAEEQLRQSEAELTDFFENATVGLHWVGPDGIILRANRAELEMLGYRLEEYVGRSISDFHADEEVISDILHRLQAGEQLREYPARLRCKDGSIRDVLIDSSAMFRDGRFVHTRCFTRDVTEGRRGQAVLACQKRVLELLVQGAPLPDVLDALCEVIETQAQDRLIATVLLVDEDGKRLRSVAGRRAPADYARGVDGVPIGPCMGSCGTAAFRREAVVVTDIATDPLWANFRDLALGHGLRACWSTPILSSQGTVLGTFAVYFMSPRPPSAEEQRLVEILTRTAGVAIERRRDEVSLREQTATNETLYRIGRQLAEEVDLHKLVQLVTDEATRLCGAQFGAFFYNVVGERGEAYTLYTVSGAPLEAFSRFPMPRSTKLFGPTFRGEGVVRLGDVTQDPRYGQSAPYYGMPAGHLPVRSYLAVPVVSRSGEVLGGLFFGHAEVGEFTGAHERLLTGIAGQAAVAIDNARLYKQTQDSEERFRQLAEHVEDVFWMADPHKPQMLYVSPAYERVWGRSRQSLYNQPRSFLDSVHPQDRQRVVASLQRQVAGEPTTEEYRVVRPDGSVRWVWDRAFPIRDAEGRVYRVAGIAEDIDERKHAEDASRFLADASTALATVEDYRSTLQKVAGLAVPAFADWCAVDLVESGDVLQRLAVVHVDPAKVRLATELYRNYPPDPDEAHGAYRVLRTGEPEFVAELSDEVLKEIARDEEHLRILRGLALRSLLCVPLTIRNRILGVVTFVYAESGRRYEARDLTLATELARRAAIAIENASLYHELKEADRRKDEFLATLAHELRNPLAPIRNGLQVLRLSGQDSGVVGEARLMMERQLNQMVRLVDDLLDVSRITRNKLDLKKQQVELAAVVQSAIETSRPLIDEAGHELSVTLPPTVVHVHADLTRLAQVFSNLLNNAAKYTEPGGRISLTADLAGAEVVVTVRDNGLGIPTEALPELFQMFSQVDRNLERSQGGLGIGLTLVRRLVEMHGGTVEAYSEGAGKGSEFVVRLPVLTSHGMPSRTPASNGGTTAVSANRRILIVDDNHDSAMSLGMMLKLLGNETHTAHDGLAAVEAAEQFRPNLILLDIGLPKLNGYDACRRIREQGWSNGMVIVALTGWGQEEDRRRSQEAGFDHHLVKPVEIADLQKLL